MAVALLTAGLAIAGPARAQDRAPTSAPTTSSTVAELPPAEMIPRPGSGEEPSDAGDRGGTLQLVVLALVLVGIAAGVAKLVRDSRRARSAGDPG